MLEASVSFRSGRGARGLALLAALAVLGALGAQPAAAAPDAIAAFRRARALTDDLADRVLVAMSSGAGPADWQAAREARDQAFEAVRGARADLRAAVAAGEVGPEVERMVAAYLAKDMHRVADLAGSIREAPPPDDPAGGSADVTGAPKPVDPEGEKPGTTTPPADDAVRTLRAVKALVAHHARLAEALARYDRMYGYKHFNATTRAAGERVGVPNVVSGGNWVWLELGSPHATTTATLELAWRTIKEVQSPAGVGRAWLVLTAESLDQYMASWQIRWADMMATMEEIVDRFVENHRKRTPGPREGLEPLYARARAAVGPAWTLPPRLTARPVVDLGPEVTTLADRIDRLARLHAREERGAVLSRRDAHRLRMESSDARLGGKISPERRESIEKELEAAEEVEARWLRHYLTTHYAMKFGNRIRAEIANLDGTSRTAGGLREQAAAAPPAVASALTATAEALDAAVAAGDARVAKAKQEFDDWYSNLVARPLDPLPER